MKENYSSISSKQLVILILIVGSSVPSEPSSGSQVIIPTFDLSALKITIYSPVKIVRSCLNTPHVNATVRRRLKSDSNREYNQHKKVGR